MIFVEMAKIWSRFFVMLWALSILSSGIYLFSRGFLLSRRVRTEQNECIRLKPCAVIEEDMYLQDPRCLTQYKVSEIFSNVNSSSDYCLPQKSRVILLVIDALKYEFGVYDKSKEYPMPYENKLPVFNRLLTEHPENSRLMKFIADAPTTTLQRLKGITTGSLPTFIDIGSNFATPEINEDNIVDQVVRNGMSAVFLGDSTWTDLYPKRFARAYSYPSFNIYDLDSIDTAINQKLPDELNQKDWSLLVAHYLGVDHCGHKYGPMHSEMTRKLSEMNAVIEKIVDQMDDDTTLFVIGDHGMTVTGDHGGDTEDEVNSLLFAYSKKHMFMANSENNEMEQIDLPPTLSAILGTPMPFSNLGAINFDIVPNVPLEHLTKSQIQMLHTWQNAKQMHLYFNSYITDNEDSIPTKVLENYLSQFHVFSFRIGTLYKEDAIESFCEEIRVYLKEVAADCRNIWVQFDANLISQGLVFTAVTTFFLHLLTTNLKFTQFGLIFTPFNVAIIYATNILLIIATPIVHYILDWDVGIIDLLRYTSIYGVALLAFLLVQNWDFITANWSTQKPFTNFFTRAIFIAAASTFFSNSFVVQEQKVLCYLLCGALVVFLYKIRKDHVGLALSRKFKPEFILHSSFFKLAAFTVFAILFLRASYLLHRCREEQENCSDFITAKLVNFEAPKRKPLQMNSVNWVDLLPILTLALFAGFSRLFLRKCGNLSGFSPHVLLARYGPIVAAVACSLHFFTTLINYSRSVKGIYQIRVDALAWVVYVLFCLQIGIIATRPLMLFILKKPNRTFDISPFGCVVPQIVMKMKQMYENRSTDDENAKDDIPIVYGLATVYSSVFCSIAIVFAFLLALLLGPNAANGVFIVLFTAIAILVLNAIYRYQRSTKLAFCLQPEVIALVSWHLLGHYSFFATSHQPTLSQINWHAAFVGRTAMYDHNNVISAVLVLLNTFGGHLLIFMLYPLLLIAPNALYAIYPSLASNRTDKIVIKNQNGTKQREIVKKMRVEDPDDGTVDVSTFGGFDSENEHMDIQHGELMLYENEDLFFGQLYKTGVQLIVLQAIRIFCSMIACTIHCRHLMVWKIFAPRFIFEAIATYFVFGAILIGFLIIIRIHKAVNQLITRMSDANRSI